MLKKNVILTLGQSRVETLSFSDKRLRLVIGLVIAQLSSLKQYLRRLTY